MVAVWLTIDQLITQAPDQGLETILTTLGTRRIEVQTTEVQAGVIRTVILEAILVRAGVNQAITEVQDRQQEDRQAEVLLAVVLQEGVHLVAVQEGVDN